MNSHLSPRSAALVLLPAVALLALGTTAGTLGGQAAATPSARDSIPLPEQPRPDFARHDWQNLNGHWRFAFDPRNAGESGRWFSRELPGKRSILVPYSWGAPLSGLPDSADIGWYSRTITIPGSVARQAHLPRRRRL